MAISETDKVLIVGAGCFGISTAYHLLKRGFRDVTVLERSEVHPAPDAASTDLNKSAPMIILSFGSLLFTVFVSLNMT